MQNRAQITVSVMKTLLRKENDDECQNISYTGNL